MICFKIKQWWKLALAQLLEASKNSVWSQNFIRESPKMLGFVWPHFYGYTFHNQWNHYGFSAMILLRFWYIFGPLEWKLIQSILKTAWLTLRSCGWPFYRKLMLYALSAGWLMNMLWHQKALSLAPKISTLGAQLTTNLFWVSFHHCKNCNNIRNLSYWNILGCAFILCIHL